MATGTVAYNGFLLCSQLPTGSRNFCAFAIAYRRRITTMGKIALKAANFLVARASVFAAGMIVTV
jgi:hypothetical protein